MPTNICITRATTGAARDILDLQKLTYQSEAALYQEYSIPPLIQTLPEMETELQNRLVLKAVTDGGIVGSVRAYCQQGTCCIGRLIVHPAYQNRGLGPALMATIAGCFPQAERYELFTGHRSRRNLLFI